MKTRLLAILRILSNRATLRALVAAVLVAINMLVGGAMGNPDDITNTISALITLAMAAWSPKTPEIVSVDDPDAT